MAADALAAGFDELLWIHPDLVFEPDDVQRLRALSVPIACGVYPLVATKAFACDFLPGTRTVRFGRGGGPIGVAACGLGFALIRREVFDALRAFLIPRPDGVVPYFAADPAQSAPAPGSVSASDLAFCERVRRCGFRVVVDTSIRLWHVGLHRYGWEDVDGDRERRDQFTWRQPDPAGRAAVSSEVERHRLRGPATPLPEGFPRLRAFVVTYPDNRESLEMTLASVRASDWGEEVVVIEQPPDWSVGRETAPANYKRALEAAAAAGCDFALILEDDVRVNRHLRHNLLTNPLVARDQCDYLGLFIPDLIADPWERLVPHLCYRLARPRYTGPNYGWEKHRVWGSQSYLLSRRLILEALTRWDQHTSPQDARIVSTCGANDLPLYYTSPCLVEHAPMRTAFYTPPAFAPDFDIDFKLRIDSGFQPPENVPGRLTLSEAELLWKVAAGLDVLELGTGLGQSTVCLSQSARRVVSVDERTQSEAAEWVRRFECGDRVEFVQGDLDTVCASMESKFGLVFLSSTFAETDLNRTMALALRRLEAGGLLAVHGYPDVEQPQVRRVVDELACRNGWTRAGQAGFLGVFRCREDQQLGPPGTG
jgi:hypothetical protein